MNNAKISFWYFTWLMLTKTQYGSFMCIYTLFCVVIAFLSKVPTAVNYEKWWFSIPMFIFYSGMILLLIYGEYVEYKNEEDVGAEPLIEENTNAVKKEDLLEAYQEFEDNAYHTSMKPVISERAKAVAMRIISERIQELRYIEE